MNLTERKKQFLQKLMDLYERTELPVHYETLAKAIGVSKWTAYDMLKQLEKLGFLNRDYTVNNRETGRSQIVYSPSKKAFDLLNHSSSKEVSLKEWEEIKKEVLAFSKQLKELSPNVAIQKVLEEISKIKEKAIFCAYILCLLIVYLNNSGDRTIYLIKHIVEDIQEHHTRLIMFVGTVIGSIIQTANKNLGSELAKLGSEFVSMIGQLSLNEKEMISDFLIESIS
jgi:predicted transcriptional regulator